ncbi:sulfurtransferase TusA [Marinomonas agarivorans]|nr:sulfurtransferase TusA [Marinomonas agarivorans]
MEFDAELDAQGLYCPEPIMMLHVEMRKLQAAQVLKVIATDPSTERDITKFCQFLGHELLSIKKEEGILWFWIKKKD